MAALWFSVCLFGGHQLRSDANSTHAPLDRVSRSVPSVNGPRTCSAAPRSVDELLRAASSWTIARPARYGIETLSNVVCAAVVVVWLLTARPTNTFAPIAIVSLPTSVHVTPSGDEYALIVLPTRSSFTQYGAPTSGPAVLVLVPAVGGPPPKTTPLPNAPRHDPPPAPGP